MATETCAWHGDAVGSDHWETDCHNAFVLNDGTPAENGMKFCRYCGRLLATDAATDEDDDNDNQD